MKDPPIHPPDRRREAHPFFTLNTFPPVLPSFSKFRNEWTSPFCLDELFFSSMPYSLKARPDSWLFFQEFSSDTSPSLKSIEGSSPLPLTWTHRSPFFFSFFSRTLPFPCKTGGVALEIREGRQCPPTNCERPPNHFPFVLGAAFCRANVGPPP